MCTATIKQKPLYKHSLKDSRLMSLVVLERSSCKTSCFR